MRKIVLSIIGCFVVFLSLGQEEIWQKSLWSSTNGESWVGKENSGEDWIYDIVLSSDESEYIYSGYVTYPYMPYLDACHTAEADDADCSEFETQKINKGSTWAVIGKMPLNGGSSGEMNAKYYFSGELFKIINTSDGGIIAVGNTRSKRRDNEYLMTGNSSAQRIPYNPLHGQQERTPFRCSAALPAEKPESKKPVAVKISPDSEGNLNLMDPEWIYLYGSLPFTGVYPHFNNPEYLSEGGFLDVIKEECDNLLFVGGEGLDGQIPKPFLTKVNANGEVLFSRTFDINYPGDDNLIETGTNFWSAAYSEGIVYLLGKVEYKYPSGHKIFVMQYNINNNQIGWTKYFESGELDYQVSTRIIIDKYGDLLLPFGDQCSSVSGNNAVCDESHVVKLNKYTGEEIDRTSFGEIRAYDLKMGIVATNDGGYALTTSKRTHQRELGYVSGNTCFDDHDSRRVAKFHNTDAFVTKCDRYGNIEWSTIIPGSENIQSGEESTWELPDVENDFSIDYDFKMQECLYHIIHTEDDNLIVAGNNSDNLDDCYVIKLKNECSDVVLDDFDVDTDLELVGPNIKVGTEGSLMVYSSANFALKAGESIEIGEGFVIEEGANVELLVTSDQKCGPEDPGKIAEIYDIPDHARLISNIETEISKDYEEIFYGFEAYPNPTSEILNVELSLIKSGMVKYSVTDVLGKVIYQVDLDNIDYWSGQIDFSEQNNGFYFINVYINDVETKRFKVMVAGH